MLNFPPLSFGQGGWGPDMLQALGITVAVAITGMMLGAILGLIGASCALSRQGTLRLMAKSYVTLLRGIPDLLIIYLFYFGSSQILTAIGGAFGATGFIGAPTFLIGAAAIGVVSGAYMTEVFRGAILAVPRGQTEAAAAYGMSAAQCFRRITLPLAARIALPGLGNVWQMVLKETALISVVGLVELMRQAQIGAGSTRQPFSFFLTAAALYLLVSWWSGRGFAWAEARLARGTARGALGGKAG